MSDKEWVNDLGTINESKNGKLYIKIDKEITLKKGDFISLKSKKQEILDSVESGKINEERGNELMEKLAFIKYTLHKAPFQPPRED